MKIFKLITMCSSLRTCYFFFWVCESFMALNVLFISLGAEIWAFQQQPRHQSSSIWAAETINFFLFFFFSVWVGLTFALSWSEADGSPQDRVVASGTEDRGRSWCRSSLTHFFHILSYSLFVCISISFVLNLNKHTHNAISIVLQVIISIGVLFYLSSSY